MTRAVGEEERADGIRAPCSHVGECERGQRESDCRRKSVVEGDGRSLRICISEQIHLAEVADQGERGDATHHAMNFADLLSSYIKRKLDFYRSKRAILGHILKYEIAARWTASVAMV